MTKEIPLPKEIIRGVNKAHYNYEESIWNQHQEIILDAYERMLDQWDGSGCGCGNCQHETITTYNRLLGRVSEEMAYMKGHEPMGIYINACGEKLLLTQFEIDNIDTFTDGWDDVS